MNSAEAGPGIRVVASPSAKPGPLPGPSGRAHTHAARVVIRPPLLSADSVPESATAAGSRLRVAPTASPGRPTHASGAEGANLAESIFDDIRPQRPRYAIRPGTGTGPILWRYLWVPPPPLPAHLPCSPSPTTPPSPPLRVSPLSLPCPPGSSLRVPPNPTPIFCLPGPSPPSVPANVPATRPNLPGEGRKTGGGGGGMAGWGGRCSTGGRRSPNVAPPLSTARS